ncbi:histidine kinase [Corallococcus macrosporus DSM 14697]|uniref:Histidine kinase n=2 Tax=Corallococcus macrosporus TaxID=35 RepID=A0A250JRS1_9BACT|nr:histidine kinase [Corallococcus macrosporus DSM 14697]
MAGKASQKAAKKAAPKRSTVKKASSRKVAAKAAPRKPTAKKAPARAAAPKAAASKRKSPVKAKEPRLLSGGNPQIAKGYGDAPVQAYIEAMPGWKRDVGLRLDALIERAVPGVSKAVKWNSPFYGVEGQGWFLGIHCFAKYIKVAFFRGMSLKPVPPGESKSQDTRYLDIRENVPLDEGQFTAWVKQASQLPGERM